MSGKLILQDPFRLFFPLGLLLGLLGVSPWIQLLWHDQTYPAVWHRLLMSHGFMLSFVTGFLMTAIPRFTKTEYARGAEVGLATFFLGLNVVFLLGDLPSFHHGSAAAGCMVLLVFAARRFARRQENPPYTFLFVGLSLGLWLLANLFLAWGNLGQFHAVWSKILYQAVILGLILGIGGRLIPGLLGWQEIVAAQRQSYERPLPFLRVVPPTVFMLALLFFASYFLEAYFWWTAHLLRLVVLLVMAFHFWRLHRWPAKRSKLSWGIWLTAWCLVLASALPLLWPGGGAHHAHAYFISGFSLLTLLVATRVTLAHGSGDTDFEVRSKMILPVTAIFILAAVTRVTAILWPKIYLSHLAYAAVLWVGALLWWVAATVPHLLAKPTE